MAPITERRRGHGLGSRSPPWLRMSSSIGALQERNWSVGPRYVAPWQWSRLDRAARGLWPPGNDRRHPAWHSASKESVRVPEGFTMSPRTLPPFRADHVGSFLRPDKLHAARRQHGDGMISAEQLRAAEDEAVREVVALQRE